VSRHIPRESQHVARKAVLESQLSPIDMDGHWQVQVFLLGSGGSHVCMATGFHSMFPVGCSMVKLLRIVPVVPRHI
jgi:hypothetical protein